MRKELEQKIVNRWLTWFDVHGDIRRTLMPWGFCHGWFDVLWRLWEDLEPLVVAFEKETGKKFEVVQVMCLCIRFRCFGDGRRKGNEA